MKILRIILWVLLFVCAVATLRRKSGDTTAAVEPSPKASQSMLATEAEAEPFAASIPVATNAIPPIEVQVPVQPIEERGDAMLYEIDALQGTPFDKAVTQPFD